MIKADASRISGSFDATSSPLMTRLRSRIAGITQKADDSSSCLKMEVSVKELHRMSEATLGQPRVYSTNF